MLNEKRRFAEFKRVLRVYEKLKSTELKEKKSW